MIDFEVEDADEEDAGEVGSAEAICWINTRACNEILNVDVCVIKNKVSMCLLILTSMNI